MKQINIFDESDRLARLAELGDQLLKLNTVIDWSIFESTLERAFAKEEPKGAGGRPPYDHMMLFKVLIIQHLYNISDAQAEYQINDRLSFQRFLGLAVSDRVPDEKTIWLFRETLAKAGVEKELFGMFRSTLKDAGLITKKGSIVDAAFAEVPRRRGTREQNKTIKDGGVPDEWADNPNILKQKDMDAKWAKKNNVAHFGYKNHVKADADSKLIDDYAVTTANVHDSQTLADLIDGDEDQVVYADSAYNGVPIPEGVEPQICEKGQKNHPLDENQKQSNREKSHIRSRVEHIFGDMNNAMGGRHIRSKGQRRAEFAIGLKNLAYNMRRFAVLSGLSLAMGTSAP